MEGPLECGAKGELSLKNKTQKDVERVDFKMRFRLKGKNSTLDLQLLTPFMSTFGFIQLRGRKGIYRDEEGERPLSRDAIFRTWLHAEWWEELAFMMGHVVFTAAPRVQMDDQGIPRVYYNRARSIQCEPRSDRPPSCYLNDEELEGWLDFSSVTCLSSL